MKKLLIMLLTGILIGGNIYMLPKVYDAWQIHMRVSEQQQISEKVLYPMVRIQIQFTEGQSRGSGVVVFSELVNGVYNTYIITCAHLFGMGKSIVYDNIKETRIKIFSEEKEWHDLNAVIIAADVAKDVALLKVETTDKYATATFAAPDIFDTMYTLEKVYHIGTMFGREIHPIESHLAQRPHEGYGRTQGPIYPGYSGGPCYLAKDLTLIGLNQRIGVYQVSPVSSINVPTIAGFIGIDLIKAWLDEIGHGFVYNKVLNAAALDTIALDSKKLAVAPKLKVEESAVKVDEETAEEATPEEEEAMEKAFEKAFGIHEE